MHSLSLSLSLSLNRQDPYLLLQNLVFKRIRDGRVTHAFLRRKNNAMPKTKQKKESKKIPGHPLSPMNFLFPTRFEETESFHSLQPTFLYYRFSSSDSSTTPLTARPPVRAGNSIALQNPKKKAEKEQKRGRDENLISTQNRVTTTTHPPTHNHLVTTTPANTHTHTHNFHPHSSFSGSSETKWYNQMQ
jgi:cell wall-associated NlpC family hydrolase